MGILKSLNLGNKPRLRVAAYCRISFDEEQEDGSYENQVEFFTREIREHDNWVVAGIYGDYARTGRQIKGRSGFKKLMKRAEDGYVDYILAKSISRFSRSATDTLDALRKLSRMGVGVYFLEQGLDTLSGYGDIILAALATIAEMESTSISDNVKTVFNGMNEKGTPIQRAAYGYRRQDKEWVIMEKEAFRVKLAYLMVASGYCFAEIARRLNQFEMVDGSGRTWDSHMVKRTILSEAYIGDVLTNKTAVRHEEGVGRKQVPNVMMEDQYYIDNHHDALVSRQLWEKITRMSNNKELAGQESFDGVDEVLVLAKKDHLLDDVRKYVPRLPGKWMVIRDERLKQMENWKHGENRGKGAV